MRPPAISLDLLAPLPEVYRAVIPAAYEDRNGHMNVPWYLALYDEAGDAMYPCSGSPRITTRRRAWAASISSTTSGMRPRCALGIRWRSARILREARNMHYMMFMANETRGVLSSIFECVHGHADLSVRRTAPFPRMRRPRSTPTSPPPRAGLARASLGVDGRVDI